MWMKFEKKKRWLYIITLCTKIHAKIWILSGFLSTLFNGLFQDKAADVKLVLNTVLEKVNKKTGLYGTKIYKWGIWLYLVHVLTS